MEADEEFRSAPVFGRDALDRILHTLIDESRSVEDLRAWRDEEALAFCREHFGDPEISPHEFSLGVVLDRIGRHYMKAYLADLSRNTDSPRHDIELLEGLAKAGYAADDRPGLQGELLSALHRTWQSSNARRYLEEELCFRIYDYPKASQELRAAVGSLPPSVVAAAAEAALQTLKFDFGHDPAVYLTTKDLPALESEREEIEGALRRGDAAKAIAVARRRSGKSSPELPTSARGRPTMRAAKRAVLELADLFRYVKPGTPLTGSGWNGEVHGDFLRFVVRFFEEVEKRDRRCRAPKLGTILQVKFR
jgi:hypothetical protein